MIYVLIDEVNILWYHSLGLFSVKLKLVKEKWGEDDTVSFTCDSITSDGEYVVAVNSIQKASVLNYFRVNLEKKTVVVDY